MSELWVGFNCKEMKIKNSKNFEARILKINNRICFLVKKKETKKIYYIISGTITKNNYNTILPVIRFINQY